MNRTRLQFRLKSWSNCLLIDIFNLSSESKLSQRNLLKHVRFQSTFSKSFICLNFIKNGWKWCEIQLIWIFLIDFDNFNWFPHFQSFNQHFQHSFWFFNLIFNWKPSKSIDQKWSKKIENWLILNRFWHRPLIGIQFWSSDLNGTEIDVRIWTAWNPNHPRFDYGTLID